MNGILESLMSIQALDRCVLIVVAPYYKDITDFLIAGTKEALETCGYSHEVVHVTGALEIPQAINIVHNDVPEKYCAYIALGCVLRGETTHYETVSNESARALMDIAIQKNAIIGNGILTCESKEQALERADPAQKDKGGEAAKAVLSLLSINSDN